MSETLTLEQIASAKLRIIDNFNFGHNLLRSPATLEQIFTQLSETIKPIVLKHNTSLSNINISMYSIDTVSRTKVNICWYKLPLQQQNAAPVYFILMNPYVGGSYVDLTRDDLNQLLLNGKISSGWYLLNQIDSLQNFISNTSSVVDISLFFSAIITKVVTNIFNNHRTNFTINEHYTLQFVTELTNIKSDVDAMISTIQIKSSSTSSNEGGAAYVYADKGTISTYSNTASLSELAYTSNSIPNIVDSKYLKNRSDVAAFLINTTKQNKNCNVRFFYAHVKFKNLDTSRPIEFTDNNYSISTQVVGKFKIKYADSTTMDVAPTCQAIPINKTMTDIFFVVMLYSNTQLTKTISSVSSENVKLLYTLKGTINDTTK